MLNVAENSHTLKPLLYKITGTWGNHEGSILLWGLILALCGGAVAAFGRSLPSALRARVIGVLGGSSAGFLLFCLLASNPFTRLWPPPLDGRDMNPLLQDPGLAFHPPILYAGYVGFAVPFAFAVAALLEGRIDAAWGRWVRPWTLASWCLLTGGIALGSWWAYYELGWGGFWFWDPVENASPAALADRHRAAALGDRGGEARGAEGLDRAAGDRHLLAVSLSGTFLVRSGILNSVHAFANDPARGVFILGLLGAGDRRLAAAVRAARAGAGAGRPVRADLARGRAGAEQHPAVLASPPWCITGTHVSAVRRPAVRRTRSRVGRAVLQRDRAAAGDPGVRGDDGRADAAVEARAARPGAAPAVVGGAGRAGGRAWSPRSGSARLLPALAFGGGGLADRRARSPRSSSASGCSASRSRDSLARLARAAGCRCSARRSAHAGLGVTIAGIAGMSLATEHDRRCCSPGESVRRSPATTWTLDGLRDAGRARTTPRASPTIEVSRDGAPVVDAASRRAAPSRCSA